MILNFSCIQSENKSLYPSNKLEIKYHSSWTKPHYKHRIDDFKAAPLEYSDIVFIGNSITEEGNDWSQKLKRNGVKNRGISGDVTDGVLARLDEIIHYKPKAVFLMIGINDLYNLHFQKEIPSAEYVGNNILKISSQLSSALPNSKIYLQTLLPTNQDFMKENIRIVNSIIFKNKLKYNYEVVDLHSIFIDKNGYLIDGLTYDGLHLNDAGYSLWASTIKPIIDNI